MKETERTVTENKMGTMPVGPLLFSMAVPIMLSMLVQAFYNVVDSVFVSMISENALTAISLAFPIQSLMISFSVGTGVGINAVLSRSLGEKNMDRVHKSALNGLLLEYIFCAAFILVGAFLIRPFYLSQTNDAEILEYGHQYMTIVCCCSFGLFSEVTFERLLQSTGKTLYSMATQMLGAVFNIIMDPILIFGLFGAPKLGVAGAAVATVMGQHLAALTALILNLRKNREVSLDLRGFRPDPFVIRLILSIGVPSIIMQAIGSIMVYGMNRILIAFTSTATAVFGVYFKINSVIFMPVFGLNNGMVPIVAYNYGARHRRRVIDTIRLTFFTAIALMTAGCLIFELIPDVLLRFFNASEHMLSIGVPAFRIIGFSFPMAGFCIACGSVFQALGKGTYSMINSIQRQLLVLLPSAYLLSLTGDLNKVWYSYIIAELFSLTCSFLFYRKIRRDIIMKIPDE